MVRDRVVIIDDDPDFRELMELFLGGWGLTCVGAGDCAEALPLVESARDRLRLVLVDYFMPGLSPCTCLSRIRERTDPEVQVVLVSAAVDIAERAAELGLSKYLSKPFETAQLRELVLDAPAAA